MFVDMSNQPLVCRAFRESSLYTATRYRAIPPSDSNNRPALRRLYEYAVWVGTKRPKAKRFTYEGVQYAIVWVGGCMCVMHVKTARVLVGAPGPRDG